ncbi:MAG: lipid asymmetry maintenance protein MlaB [Gammaproteobacteria bacterium]
MALRRDGARLVLDGPVTLATHAALRAQAATLASDGDLEVDWSGVETVDSSALALILHWQRTTTARGARAAQTHLPQALLALAELYGVQELL